MRLITDNGIEIEFEKIQTMEIKRGEILVLTLSKCLPNDANMNILQKLYQIFPDNKVLIMENGMEFHIIEDIEARKRQ